jgi:hypothetical protein
MGSTVWETGSEQVTYLGEMTRRIGGFELEKERSLLSDPRVMDLLFREKAGTMEELPTYCPVPCLGYTLAGQFCGDTKPNFMVVSGIRTENSAKW